MKNKHEILLRIIFGIVSLMLECLSFQFIAFSIYSRDYIWTMVFILLSLAALIYPQLLASELIKKKKTSK